jgi:selenocysteine lyase/cysteine desulfurase
VTGLIMPLQKIHNILNKVDTRVTTLFFADYACSAPYVQIDGSILDGMVFSGHKFHGGISTPGILIAKEHLFNKSIPHDTGGGCVCKCTTKEVVYEKDIEKRESAGTPNIIGIIRLERAVHIKNVLHEIITERELELCKIIKYKIKIFGKKYGNFVSILSGKTYNPHQHLPIFTFSLVNTHYNFIVVLLNDLFGIQTRGGISCCGLLGEYVEKTIGVKGWCRISLHWSMSDNDVKFIFDSVEHIIQHHTEYTNMYKYNDKENLFYYTLTHS